MIICKKKNGPFVRVVSPDDLFKVGLTDVNCADFFGEFTPMCHVSLRKHPAALGWPSRSSCWL